MPSLGATRAVSLLIAVLAATWLPACAEQSAQDVPRCRFELSARMVASMPLTRADVDPGAVKLGSLGVPSPVTLPENGSGACSQPGTARTGLGEVDPGSIKEYSIDWSRWMSVLADRWWYVLKGTEHQLGLRFVTARPAMIQFTCYADGSIGNIVLRQSSGIPIYDRLQMETLMASMPAPPFPAGTKRESITLCQGWESHAKRPGEEDFQPGSFGREFPKERVRQWCAGR
jgi:hypothetical protein